MPKTPRNLLARLIIAGFLAGGAVMAAFAHSGATGVVKQRMDAMSDIAEQMKMLGDMVQGKTAFDAELAEKAASIVAGHASEIPALFPEGSTENPSEALPAIWSDWPRFEDMAREMGEDAEALVATVKSASGGVEIKKEFADLAAGCKSCHETFRLKK